MNQVTRLLTQEIDQAESRAMKWLLHAFEKSNDGGCPHSRWLFVPGRWKWLNSYAETTGYVLENLLDFNIIFPEKQRSIAERAGDWLCSVQHPDGYFCKGVQHKEPSVFNTAQILVGLDALYRHFGDEKYENGILRGVEWLLMNLDDRGRWKQGLYVPTHYSSYYARALWVLCRMDQRYGAMKHRALLSTAIGHLQKLVFPNLIPNSGFFAGKAVFSHSLAYALEGFFQIAWLAQDDTLLKQVTQVLDGIHEHLLGSHKFPGLFYLNGKTNERLVCTTGHAQMAALFFELARRDPEKQYEESASILMRQLMRWQFQSVNEAIDGGFSASQPVWGAYFPWRMVNWTNKFFLDACYQYHRYHASVSNHIIAP